MTQTEQLKQALLVLTTLASMAPVPLKDHQIAAQAAQMLEKALMPPPAPPKEEDKI